MARKQALDLFEDAARQVQQKGAPLADRMRPRTLGDFVGQEDILGENRILRRLLSDLQAGPGPSEHSEDRLKKPLPSLSLWGPPGTGKTTLAHLIAQTADAHFAMFSAVSSGVKDARQVMREAADRLALRQRRTVLFVDEIHRFNKAQQDAFLPAIEDGTISLLGATTENPSFELNSALLSRCRVFVLRHLSGEEIGRLLDRALSTPGNGLDGTRIILEPKAREALCQLAGGDARSALNGLELAALTAPLDDEGRRVIDEATVKEALQRNTILYDASGEEHYNLISAFHKSIRHSDPDAALYYLARMIEGGEDPVFIARRIVRAASEDIGLADPQAVIQALAAKQSVEFIGYPECDTALAQATVYLACAPKSNAIYTAMKAAKSEVKKTGPVPVPMHLRNAPTDLMEKLGYGKGYAYDHDWPDKISPQNAMPEELSASRFYTPGSLGFEKEIQKRLDYFARIRDRLRGHSPEG